MAPDKDPQMDRLNAQLHDDGCAPKRDLWQGIEEAIVIEEERLLKKPAEPKPVFWRPKVLMAVAAVATFAMILIPLNYNPEMKNRVVQGTQVVINVGLDLGQSEMMLTQAMSNLEKAALEYPDDPNLLRLVRMVNSRQGKLLRCKWTENTRVQDLLDGGVS